MASEHPRLRRERKTIEAMVGMYCRDHHAREGLCPECRELLDFANCRLDKCPYQEKKPTCANCPIHCYKPDMKERVRTVMRYSGPRLMRSRPFLALMHVLDGFRKAPPKRRGK